MAYRNEIPYCETDSKPFFQTKVTSQAFVACSLQERNAETALPPTMHGTISLNSHNQRCGQAAAHQRVNIPLP